MYRLKNLPFLIEMYKENKNFNKIKTLFSFKLEKQDKCIGQRRGKLVHDFKLPP